jgi:hypothetical protein
MKKIFAIIALMVSTACFAQIKEGRITYNSHIEGIPDNYAAMAGLGTEIIVYFKTDKALFETNSTMYNVKTLIDTTGKLKLIEQKGQKQFMKISANKMDKEHESLAPKDFKIEYTSDTKTIAGYKCKKAISTGKMSGTDIQTTIWYTDAIYNSMISDVQYADICKGLKGVPLEYTMKMGTLPQTVTYTATNVSTQPISDEKFVLSTNGYKEMQWEEVIHY